MKQQGHCYMLQKDKKWLPISESHQSSLEHCMGQLGEFRVKCRTFLIFAQKQDKGQSRLWLPCPWNNGGPHVNKLNFKNRKSYVKPHIKHIRKRNKKHSLLSSTSITNVIFLRQKMYVKTGISTGFPHTEKNGAKMAPHWNFLELNVKVEPFFP